MGCRQRIVSLSLCLLLINLTVEVGLGWTGVLIGHAFAVLQLVSLLAALALVVLGPAARAARLVALLTLLRVLVAIETCWTLLDTLPVWSPH